MHPLNVKDPQLSSSCQQTLTVLLAHGTSTSGKHSITAAQVQAMGLTKAAFRELATAGLATVTNVPGGSVMRPETSVATEVVLRDNGDVDVTLALDLV
ncbi:hypothetical protein [Paraburkholderia youngii]|uniref:hypothetical protein n=1 Tax=Paraburkholderia youngii TaxID=2782701 RepID=UPI003D21DF13